MRGCCFIYFLPGQYIGHDVTSLAGGFLVVPKMNGSPRYTVIMHDVREKHKMTLTEYAIADSIYHLQNNPEHLCKASKVYLGNFIGLKRRATIDIINKLVARKLVLRIGGGLRTTKKWNVNYIRNRVGTTLQVCRNITEGVQKPHSNGAEIAHNNNTITTNIYETIEHTFRNKFKQETDEEYRINYAKDRALMKPLIKKYGEKKIISLIDLWFNDDFGEKCGYTIGGFSSCFNKLLLRANSGEKTKEKNTRKIVNDMEMLRQDKALHPEKYSLPK